MHMDTDNVLPHLAFDTVSADFSHMDYLPDIFWNVSGIGLLKAYMPKKICFIRRFLFNFLVSDTRVEECQIKIPKKIFNDAWPYISTLQKHMGHRAVGNRQDDLSNKYMTEVFKLFRFSPYGHFNIKVNRIKQDETFMSVSYNQINETELDMETPDTSFEGTTTGYMDFPILRLFESINDDLPVDKNYPKDHLGKSELSLVHNKATFERHAEQGGLNINMRFTDPADFEKCLQEIKEKGLKHCWYKDLRAGVFEIAFKIKKEK